MSQVQRVFEILKDGRPHSTYEIFDIMFPSGKRGGWRLGARVGDINEMLKKLDQWKGYKVVGMTDREVREKRLVLSTDKNPQRYWYQLKKLTEVSGQMVMI